MQFVLLNGNDHYCRKTNFDKPGQSAIDTLKNVRNVIFNQIYNNNVLIRPDSIWYEKKDIEGYWLDALSSSRYIKKYMFPDQDKQFTLDKMKTIRALYDTQINELAYEETQKVLYLKI